MQRFGRVCGRRWLSSEGRQLVSREERRRNRAMLLATPSSRTAANTSSFTTGALWVSVGLSTGVLCLGGWALLADPEESEIAKAAQESALGSFATARVAELCAPFVNPSRDKLLPDWPPDYLNISPDVPCPHTLVVDLDGTLVRATWDRRYGWRHAKRPGADAFLREMGKYYEIVIFTSNIAGVADPVIHALDKEGYAMHRLYRDATRFVRGTHCKDLSRLNRDPRKIILVDDDPRAVQLQPQNAILVTPYDDENSDDSELEDLIPFLAAIVNEGVTDVPGALRKFSDNKAQTVAKEYDSMLADAKQKSDSLRSIGLGGFLRASAASAVPKPDLAPADTLTAADIVGDAPPPEPPAKGRFWKRIQDISKESQENQKRKMEAWQKILQKKEQQKRIAQEQQQNKL